MSFSSGKNLQNNINLDEAQTLQNKTLDSTNTVNDAPINNSTITGASIVSPDRADVKKDTQANLETYAATATEGQLVYATDTKTMYQIKNNALSEVSGGAGGINYIENSDFEINLDGYTDDVNLTLARTTLANEILRGSASGKISKAAVDASGQEISIPFTVDRAGLASKITVSLEVDASDANYADGDLRLAVRQDPNGTPSIIRLNGEDIKGGKGKIYAQFQSDATIDEYELLIQCNSTNASAYDVIIDDVKVGPREVAYGTLITDWIEFTPTGTWVSGNETYTGWYRRKGDSIDVRYMVELSGAPTAVDLKVDLPNGLIGDISKIPDTTNGNFRSIGQVMSRDDSAGLFYSGRAGFVVNNTGVIYVYNYSDNGNFENIGNVDNNSPITFANNDWVEVVINDLPIQGWSSNAASSEDLGGREIVVRGAGNSGAAITASTERIDFTVIEDTTASWSQVDSNGTDTFTAPETGYYAVNGCIRLSASDDNFIYIYIDGSEYGPTGNARGSSSFKDFSDIVYLEKGQELSLRLGLTATLSNSTTDHRIHIQKLASPQTVLETETVAARYTSDSGQTINNTKSTFVYEDLVSDTHNAYNTSTGEYTVPVSGYYQVSAQVTASGTTGDSSIYVVVDGVDQKRVRKRVGTNETNKSHEVVDYLLLEKGQVLKIDFITNATTSAVSNGIQNVFSIARIK